MFFLIFGYKPGNLLFFAVKHDFFLQKGVFGKISVGCCGAFVADNKIL